MEQQLTFYSPKIGEKGLTPLHYYAWWYHPPAIKWALKNGGDVHALDDVYQQTPLLMLGKIYSGDIRRKKRSFRLLVKQGSDLFAKGKNGATLLQEVKRMGNKGFKRFVTAEYTRINKQKARHKNA